MSPLLDLSGAKENSFDALPSGTYVCEVFKAEMKETKGGENAKLPKGTPMMNFQFRVIGSDDGERGEDYEYYNRRLFRQYVIAPEKVGGKKYEHKAMMDGQILTLFKALGFEEEEIKSGDFDPDLADLVGIGCRVVAKKKVKFGFVVTEDTPPESIEYDNEVTNVKPLIAGASAGGGAGPL